ncbi:MAG: 5'/3'-nucleotidase SurE [Lachnospiraceae bacterium]|nr:5'/3'-nucleotidase SurE [Lachnospiraceae bacterium]
MKNILITNDDGIDSDGIIRLAAAAKKYGDVWVVAPEKQCSAQSHSITLRHSIKISPHAFPLEGVHAFAVSGTPADCVRVGTLSVMRGKPDVVLSGINYGYNMATDIQYSATAGAAFEAEFQGYTAIALSEAACDCHEATDRYLDGILEKLIDEPYVPGQIINVNFPGCPLSQCRGILWDRKVSRLAYYKDRYNTLKEYDDGTWEVMVEGLHFPALEEGTDYGAILTDHVSVGRVNNIG